MKLIDADVFESVLDFADSDVCEESPDGHCDFGFSRGNIMELLRDIPAIDAVPVVRCRECKKKNKKKCPMTIVNFGRDGKEILVQNHVPDDFYCAAGERKEGADNG